MLDISRVCVDCREPFVVSASAQAWFRSRKWVLPSRCPDCRALRRRETGQAAPHSARSAES
ncbi:MAG: zinc-ribbon domain containing protein [Vicinamibacteria bacterium]|nr:zinc-ribbon domain containing protein [Vicinamibacteria bacterium]